MRPHVLLLCCAMLAGLLPARVAAAFAGEHAVPAPRAAIHVLVPDEGNLQLLAFWAALGAGYFAEEGLDVQVSSVDKPAAAEALFKSGSAPVALLHGPSYERLISERFPFLLAANLLANDPVELVIRRDIAERLQISAGMPLRQRLDALQGLSIGVAAPFRARLYRLFRSQGLDADRARIVQTKPDEQLASFGARLDGIYTETPVLERALLDKDGIVVVDQAAGEVPELSERLVQALAVTRAFAAEQPAQVAGLVRAIARAEHLVRFDKGGAVTAIVRALPQAGDRYVAQVVSLYAPAVPATPHVEAHLLAREAALYPVGGEPLKLGGIDLHEFVLGDVGGGGDEPHGSSPRKIVALACALALGIALFFVIADGRERSREVG